MTLSTDTDAVGTLITTEFGGPPNAGQLDAYQIKNVYPYLYDPTDNPPPLDQAEGALDLQEQEWLGEVQYLQEHDPEFLAGETVGVDVVFENPLDTLNPNAIDVGEHVVDFDAVNDDGNPVAYGLTESAEEVEVTPASQELNAEAEAASVRAQEDAVLYPSEDAEVVSEAPVEEAETVTPESDSAALETPESASVEEPSTEENEGP